MDKNTALLLGTFLVALPLAIYVLYLGIVALVRFDAWMANTRREEVVKRIAVCAYVLIAFGLLVYSGV